ncbi:MAG: hypothetical protein WDN49_22500 [Acetobacteraceae bacterium]
MRLAQLARLVMALDGRFGAPATVDRAWPLAAELAALMDEAERAEIDLETALPGLAAEDYAAHWQVTLEFLAIVTRAWPAWLAENGVMNPAARQVALLRAQAEAWSEAPPPYPVLAAGSTGGIPAVARLLRVVAAMPQGRVVLPGLDLALDDLAWDCIEDSHPQAGLRRLLTRLGGDARRRAALGRGGRRARRADHPAERALLPAQALGAWRGLPPADLHGLSRLTPADQQEEAVAIALILRDALETPNARAALVTPDRGLAGRVRGGTGAVRRHRRRQRGRGAGRDAPRDLPAPARRRRGRGLAPGAAAVPAEAPFCRRRAGAGRVPRRRARAGGAQPARPRAETRHRGAAEGLRRRPGLRAAHRGRA